MMGSVFAMQGLGQLCAAVVMICVTAGFKESLLTASKSSKALIFEHNSGCRID